MIKLNIGDIINQPRLGVINPVIVVRVNEKSAWYRPLKGYVKTSTGWCFLDATPVGLEYRTKRDGDHYVLMPVNDRQAGP